MPKIAYEKAEIEGVLSVARAIANANLNPSKRNKLQITISIAALVCHL